ncbi:MAG: hydrogen peroxide-inducible genes activator [Saezia sp.]
MTLTELRYIVAVAKEKHFGRAAATCFVSQPTLSVGIKKLEDELEVQIFERGVGEVEVTPLGRDIILQAKLVLEEANMIRSIARRGQDQLSGPLRLGVIYTIGPYLLPQLVRHNYLNTPQMPLLLQENFTVNLLEMLRSSEVDCAIMAEPFSDVGLSVIPLYDEPFYAAVPVNHRLAKCASVDADDLKSEPMLLLGAGHCFRDQVLEICSEFGRIAANAQDGLQRTFEGSSLETIRQMVISGMGLTIVPRLAISNEAIQGKGTESDLVRYIPFKKPIPERRVVLAWRKSFPRTEAIDALVTALRQCPLSGVKWV